MGSSDRESRYVSIVTRPRQVRVAYLIDPQASSLELLDAITSTCSRAWGGRLSPIIPIVGDEIPDDYWQVLRAADPDWIYSYVSIPQTIVDRLSSEIAPIQFTKHSDHLLQGERP